MSLEGMAKRLIIFIVLVVSILKKYYFVFVIVGIVFIAYKLSLHEKIYKVLNQFTNNTLDFQKKEKTKKRFLKFLFKQNKGGEI